MRVGDANLICAVDGVPMEITHDMEQILLECKSKSYIKSNTEWLRTYFSTPERTDALKTALTTNRNFTVLKIIEQLNLKIVPYIYINKFTFISLYWLNRMNVIPNSDFEALVKKFEILKSFDDLYVQTERNFIELQIQKRRRTKIGEHMESIVKMDVYRYFKPCLSMSFFFIIDDLIDILRYTQEFPYFERDVFRTSLRTFNEFTGDPERNEKTFTFRDIRISLSNASLRNFSQFYKLAHETQDRVETVMRAVTKIKRTGNRYYICSRQPLPSILTFCYLFMNNIDLTKAVEFRNLRDLEFPCPGRRVVFGRFGNVSYEYLSTVMESLRITQNRRD